jgi:uncharacterized protein (TIGR03000 family)
MFRQGLSKLAAPALTAAALLFAAGPVLAQHHGGGHGGGHGDGHPAAAWHGGSSTWHGGTAWHDGHHDHSNFFFGFGVPWWGWGGGYPYYGYGSGYGYYPGYYSGYYPNYYPNYSYMQSPTDYQSFYPPPATTAPNNAVLLNIHVPANAELWIGGTKVNTTGADRQFVSPPLTPGRNYTYDIRARWTDANGQGVDQVRHVNMQVGAVVNVDFTAPAAR